MGLTVSSVNVNHGNLVVKIIFQKAATAISNEECFLNDNLSTAANSEWTLLLLMQRIHARYFYDAVEV
jgi:hypothetical protein